VGNTLWSRGLSGGEGLPEHEGIPPSSGGLRKVLDIDFRLMVTQDLIGGGSFTIGGQTWVTRNEGNATVLKVLNGTGLQIHPDATSSAWGRPTTNNAPGIYLDDPNTVLAEIANFRGFFWRVHLDTSSADAATEYAVIAYDHKVGYSLGMTATGVGHDGANPKVFQFRDSSTTTDTVDASHAGAAAVIAVNNHCTGWDSYTGTGTDPALSALTVRRGTSCPIGIDAGHIVTSNLHRLHLAAASGNTDANFTPTIHRIEGWAIEVAPPW